MFPCQPPDGSKRGPIVKSRTITALSWPFFIVIYQIKELSKVRGWSLYSTAFPNLRGANGHQLAENT